VASGIIAEFANANLGSDAHLASIFTELQPLNEELTASINRIKAESDLEEKDELRDSKVKAINYITLGFIHHPDVAISTAAKTINAIFEHYGMDIINKSYGIESSLISSLLLEFSKEELQPVIALLPGLAQIIEELRTAEAAFEVAQLAFQTEKAIDGNKKPASDLKKEVLAIINEKLLVYLRAMIMVDLAKYGQFADVVSQIIDDMNITIKKRKKSTEPETPAIA